MNGRQANHRRKNKKHSAWKRGVLVLLLFLLLAVLFLRYRNTAVPGKEAENRKTEIQSETAAPDHTALPIQAADGETDREYPGETENPAMEDTEPTSAIETEEPADTEEKSSTQQTVQTAVPAVQPMRTASYSEQTYQLVTDLVYTRRYQGAEGEESVLQLLEELKTADPELGRLWESIMNYWAFAGDGLAVNPDILPDGLPEDSSLCITVLGFQLMYDGTMAPELTGRCEIALASAKKYPNAYLLVTGGGTAAGNRSATEADVMAEWLIRNGVDAGRIIIENQSLTTDQNAVYSCRILADDYPEVKSLAIVSSDYHVALGSMLFTEAALLYGYGHYCEAPYQVVSNAAYRTAGNETYSNPSNFGADIWVMADPTY